MQKKTYYIVLNHLSDDQAEDSAEFSSRVKAIAYCRENGKNVDDIQKFEYDRQLKHHVIAKLL